jgi:hypothetical protein
MEKSRTIANPSPGTCRADALRKLDTLITRRTNLNRMTLILSLKIGSLVSFITLLYAQDLIAASQEALSDEASSYLLAIPILLAFIVYCKRNVLGAIIRNPSITGALKDKLVLARAALSLIYSLTLALTLTLSLPNSHLLSRARSSKNKIRGVC